MLRSLLFVLALLPTLAAQQGRNVAEYSLDANRLAVQGYDPVAYFEIGGSKPTKGKSSITHEHGGAVYRFATEAHRELFVGSPATYEPSFGGWCSFAMSKNMKKKVDPAAFRVTRGRLLLFSDTDYVEFDDDWVPKEHKLLRIADDNWKAMSGESPRTADLSTWRKYNEFNLSDDSLAIEGYDPVAYFPEGGGKVKKGDKKITLRHAGVLYRFASKKHRDLFAADPGKYEPVHGGWCSYAMGAEGSKVEVDPEAFRLTDGQLHLFYNSWLTDTRDDWDEDTASLKRKADKAWSELLKKAPPAS